MAICDIFKECELLELTLYDNGDTYEIKDNIQMDFFYLLKGECSLVFEVNKIYDPN